MKKITDGVIVAGYFKNVFMQRDGFTESIWQRDIADHVPSNSITDEIYDVVIAGGGMTGIATGLILQESGKKCLIAEAKTIGFGTTSGTSAHLNTMLDSTFAEIEKKFGEQEARQVCSSAKQAIFLIQKNVSKNNIDCDFTRKDGYLFSQGEKQHKELEKIFKASRNAGVNIEWADTLPIPVDFDKAVIFTDQAQFHPIKYLLGIATAFEKAGGVILQQCRVTSFEGDDILEIETSKGIIKARTLIYATHVPPGVNLLHFRCAPYRSYVVAAKLKDSKYPDALVYDMFDPYHYYRTQIIGEQKYLIAGGEDHKTADEENTGACFNKLESYLRQYFDIDHISYKWSSQYYIPVDGLPYIGNLPGNPSNVYVATGYNGNGMIYAHVAAKLLHDIIVAGKSEYEELYDPNRIKPVAGFSNFIKEAADVTATLVSSIFPAEKITALSDMAKDEARIVKYEGKTVALYKDENGQVHAVDPACTHIACSVSWNSAERSWDCPCHGSRFDADGEMLNAPARKNLQQIKLEEK